MDKDLGKYTHKSELVVTSPEVGDLTDDSDSTKEGILSQEKSTDVPGNTIGDAQPGFTKIQSADDSVVIANQPRQSSRKVAHRSFHSPFDDAHCERDWGTGLCMEKTERRSYMAQCCCWPAYRYSLAVRLGETPFMPLIPCAALSLRIKIRTLFGIKGSLIKDFFTSLFCEPCAVCQMTREMDVIGL